MGRPTKLTSEVRNRIIEIVSAGNTRRVAANIVGIRPETLSRWANGEKPYHIEFSQALREAEALAEMRCVEAIVTSAKNDWRAAAWYLERRYPERWGKKSFEGRLNRNGVPVEEVPSRVLVVPSVIDDIHEWSRRAKRRIENNNAKLADQYLND